MDQPGNSSIENAFMQDLKDRLKTAFGEIIDAEILKYRELHPDSSQENVINAISQTVASCDKFSTFNSLFIDDVIEVLNEDDVEYKDIFSSSCSSQNENYLCGSVSSLNSSSIDFLSPEQLVDVAYSLGSNSALRRLEALSVFYRLSTLEHVITKQNLWTDIEAKFYDIMLSNINLLQAGCLKTYMKMLSSPDPQVVCKGYISLINFFREALSDRSYGDSDISNFLTKVMTLLDNFLQRVPFRWLRYPLKIVEDIVVNFISAIDSCYPMVWSLISVVDPCAKWMTSLLHGKLSRSILLDSFEREPQVLMVAVSGCRDFIESTDYEILNCCEDGNCKRVTHDICFLSQFFQYSDGRNIISNLESNESQCPGVLELIMQCAFKLCEITCFACAVTSHEALSKAWNNIFHMGNNKTISLPNVFGFLTVVFQMPDIASGATPKLCLVSKCLCEILKYIDGIECTFNCEILGEKFYVSTIQQVCEQLLASDFISNDSLNACQCFMHLIKSIIKVPKFTLANNFTDIDLLKVIIETREKLGLVTPAAAHLDFDLQSKCLDDCSHAIIAYILKPYGYYVCSKKGYYDKCIPLLTEIMLKNKSNGKNICSCDISALITVINNSIVLNVDMAEKDLLAPLSILQEFPALDSSCWKNLMQTLMVTVNEWLCLSDNISHEFIKQSNYFCMPRTPSFGDEDNFISMLEVMSVLIFNVHAMLFLYRKFNIAAQVLDLISQYVIEDGSVVIDCISSLLNYIVVKLYSIGGPTECILPQISINCNEKRYDWPITTSYPLSPVYYKGPSVVDREECIPDGDDLYETQVWFINSLKEGSKINPICMMCCKCLNFERENVEHSIDIADQCDDDFEVDQLELTDEIKADIQVIVRYGSALGPWSNHAVADLERLLKKCVHAFGIIQDHVDLFVSTIFLMFKCNSSAAWLFLNQYFKTRSHSIFWKTTTYKPDLSIAHDAVMMELCDFIVMKSLPSIYSAFQISNTQPSVIYQYWTKQLYWNYLDFEDISNFVILTVLFGEDYSIYFFVSVLRHLELLCLKSSHKCALLLELKSNSIKNYTIKDNVDYIMTLGKEYSEIVKESLHNCSE